MDLHLSQFQPLPRTDARFRDWHAQCNSGIGVNQNSAFFCWGALMLQMLKRRRTPPPPAPRDTQWLSQLQQQAIALDEQEVIADLSNVERIDSRELGELVKLHLALRQNDRCLVLDNARSGVLEVFEMTRMDRLMRIRGARSVE